jgi:cytidylate kinase
MTRDTNRGGYSGAATMTTNRLDHERRDRPVVIAIDGPAGAGKTTLARRLALALHLPHVNTGLMYRALARRALLEDIDAGDGGALASEAVQMRFGLAGEHPPELSIEGRPPPASLMAPAVEAVVSTVASHPEVRRVLRREQRRLGSGGAVMEGRDIGTAIFPEAEVKIFLEASRDARAWRRVRERKSRDAGLGVGVRDSLDAMTTPLLPAAGAYILDTTALSAEDVFARALAHTASALHTR